MQPMRISFFFLGEGLFVANVFPRYSHFIPIMFLKYPIHSLRHSQKHLIFYPVLFGHGSTSMYITCKGERVGVGGEKGSMTKRASIGSQNIADRPMKCLVLNK